MGGNVEDEFIADPETEDNDGTITIVVREDVYEVRMPDTRLFCIALAAIDSIFERYPSFG